MQAPALQLPGRGAWHRCRCSATQHAAAAAGPRSSSARSSSRGRSRSRQPWAASAPAAPAAAADAAGADAAAGAAAAAARPGRAPEMCVIVDEQNNVVGAATRHETVSRRLLGRGSYVLLFNARGELFVSKRSAAKDVYPGALDVVISGVVNQGESYADTAIRELEEEVGVPPSHSQQHLRQELIFPYEDEVCRVFGTVFSLTFDGALVFADAEVESGRFVGLEELARQLRERPADFTPVGRHILGLWLSDRRRQQQHVEQERQSDQRSG